MRFAALFLLLSVAAAPALEPADVVVICNKAVPESRAVAEHYLAVPQTAARATKRLMRTAFERDFASVYQESLGLLERCLGSPDVAAARQAWAHRQAGRHDGESRLG